MMTSNTDKEKHDASTVTITTKTRTTVTEHPDFQGESSTVTVADVAQYIERRSRSAFSPQLGGLVHTVITTSNELPTEPHEAFDKRWLIAIDDAVFDIRRRSQSRNVANITVRAVASHEIERVRNAFDGGDD
jgi:hypothetical protein